MTQGGKPVAPGVAPTKPDAMATLLKRALLGNAYFKGVGACWALPLQLLVKGA